MNRLGIIIIFVLYGGLLKAQTDSISRRITFSTYIETYYAYDAGQPSGNDRPSFVYSYNRHNEVNLNLGLVKATYESDLVRANMALAAGTYMQRNQSAEPDLLRNVFEANIGVKLSKKQDLWVDAGIFPSHIGFESAIGRDCWNLSRSMMADNSPYYEAGLRLSYKSRNQKWFISGLMLNGWQRIKRADGDASPSFGHQLTFTPNNKVTINSSSYIGSDQPDSISRLRLFHNLYAIISLNDRLALTAGLDLGWEDAGQTDRPYLPWSAQVLMVRYRIANRQHLSARLEHFQDRHAVIISKQAADEFDTWGFSVNHDLAIRQWLLWRVEARGFRASDRWFQWRSRPSHGNFFISSSLALSF